MDDCTSDGPGDFAVGTEHDEIRDPEIAHPRLMEVLEKLRDTVTLCERSGISRDTILAAMMTDMAPRLVRAYGNTAVAIMLGRLADQVACAAGAADRVRH
jgi:hypothetical protein